jgi:hypothetical protein
MSGTRVLRYSMNLKLRQIILVAFTLACSSCAPLQPANVGGPRGNEAAYPVLFQEDVNRADAALVALNRLLPQSGSSPTNEFKLRPITATIESLPPTGSAALYLPKVGSAAVMNEEETRESLRRFIRDWSELIGSAPARLSLVEHLVQPDGSGTANYEQRPFRFPIRGNYGKLQIRFAADRRIISLSSTCIPDAGRVQSVLRTLGVAGALAAKLTGEDAIKRVRENEVPYADPKTARLTYRLPAGAELSSRELVTYVKPSSSVANALEFHIAWEIAVTNAPVKLVYVDSINGEIIAAE